MKHQHNNIYELLQKAPDLNSQILFLASTIHQLQAHCDYYHEVLEKNGIEFHTPDYLQIKE